MEIIVGGMNPNVITVTAVSRIIERMVGDDMHTKRVASVTNAVVGVVHAASLSIHAIGAGLAGAAGLHAKHAIKQVDRLLSNPALRVWTLFADWVPYVLAARTAIVVALDWTEFDADGHARLPSPSSRRTGARRPWCGRRSRRRSSRAGGISMKTRCCSDCTRCCHPGCR